PRQAFTPTQRMPARGEGRFRFVNAFGQSLAGGKKMKWGRRIDRARKKRRGASPLGVGSRRLETEMTACDACWR
ncbi:MAG TPA: hypothetical protein VL096_18150, partial [Pirellulaceae bacterium]|nr:hypothetical protein [Pirellulaceae bacterium]